jgi:hypothetical protein
MSNAQPKPVDPGRAATDRADHPRAKLRHVRLAAQMRTMIIAFWVVLMSLTWLAPNHASLAKRGFATIWLSLVVAGGVSVLHFVPRKLVRQQRRAAGCCLECGYDLRATPERCPECGAARQIN